MALYMSFFIILLPEIVMALDTSNVNVYVDTIFICIETRAIISYKWLLTRRLHEPFPHLWLDFGKPTKLSH